MLYKRNDTLLPAAFKGHPSPAWQYSIWAPPQRGMIYNPPLAGIRTS